MKFISLLINLMCMTNNNNIKKNTDYSDFYKANNYINNFKNTRNDTSGMDERPDINIDTIEQLAEINMNIHRKRVLDALINPSVATLQKIDIINEYDILPSTMRINIYEGGLLDDFNFTIF